MTVFGGFAPFIATWLIAQTGDPLSPSFYLIATAFLSIIALVTIQRRTARAGMVPGAAMSSSGFTT